MCEFLIVFLGYLTMVVVENDFAHLSRLIKKAPFVFALF